MRRLKTNRLGQRLVHSCYLFIASCSVMIFCSPAARSDVPREPPPPTAGEHDDLMAQAAVDRAKAAYNSGNYDAAVEGYTAALKVKSGDARLYYNRGLAYFKDNKDLDAVADFSKALELAPQFILAHLNRGRTYLRLSRFEDSLQDFTKAIELKGDDHFFWYCRAAAYANLNKKDAAISDLNQALALNPTDVPSYIARADIFFSLQKLAEAGADYRRILTLRPDAEFAKKRLLKIETAPASKP